MRKYLILLFTVFVFTTSSADTSKIKDKFFSSIESYFNNNFEDTQFSFKSKEGNKPEIGILTFKPFKLSSNLI